MTAACYANPTQLEKSALMRLAGPSARLSHRLQLARRRTSGGYRSPFHGRGMEFAESREYTPGDDARHLDWKVSARTGQLHTKVFSEERERPVFCWVDLGATMYFGTQGALKAVAAAHVATILAWAAAHGGDRCGGFVFSESEDRSCPPRRGPAGASALVRALVDMDASRKERIGSPQPEATECWDNSLARLQRSVRPGALIFMVSDFREISDDSLDRIRSLARHDEIVLVAVSDPLERQLPPAGLYTVTDGLGRWQLDSRGQDSRRDYAAKFIARQQRLKDLAKLPGITYAHLGTEDDVMRTTQDIVFGGG